MLTELTLPSGRKIKVENNPTIGDMENIEEQQPKSNYAKIIMFAVQFVKEWDFKDNDGKVLPITPENIKKIELRGDGVVFLTEIRKIIEGTMEGQPKKK